MPTDNHEINQPLNPEHGVRDSESPGYETTDANVNGVVVFLAGLFGSMAIFFVVAFVLGRVINEKIVKVDGPVSRWNQLSAFTGAEMDNGKRQDMANAPEMQQKQLQQLVEQFPAPRLDIDDGEQSTADLHAREDLLLDNYSTSPGEGENIRIPITRAMELIAQRGLPVSAPASTPVPMFGDDDPVVQAPLTDGFARTGYELDVIKAREQKLEYGHAEGAAHQAK